MALIVRPLLLAASQLAVEARPRFSALRRSLETSRRPSAGILVAISFMRTRVITGSDLGPRLAIMAIVSGLALIAVSFLLPSSSESSASHVTETQTARAEVNPDLDLESVLDTDLAIYVSRTSRFAWPAFGPITTYFGAGHPTGIDISLPWDDAPILASAAGTVSFAGGSVCCHYGLYVIVEHPDGFSTLYGHLDKISVKEGQRVSQNQLLGLGGDTGNSSGKHLHFEVLSDNAYLDPLRFLPARQVGPNALPETANCDSGAIQVDSASRVTLSFATGKSIAKVEAAQIQPVAAAPAVEAQTPAEGQVVLGVPLASSATSKTYSYDLAVNLRTGDEERTVNCRLALATIPTLANPPSPRLTALAAATPTPSSHPPEVTSPAIEADPAAELQEQFVKAQAVLAANAASVTPIPGTSRTPIPAPTTVPLAEVVGAASQAGLEVTPAISPATDTATLQPTPVSIITPIASPTPTP